MGYRLNIDKIIENKKTYKEEIKNIYYDTKLYGYTDEEQLLSFIYLVSIGKLEKAEFFDYGSNQKFALNKKEFTIFCYLYNIDLYKFSEYHKGDKDWFIKQKEIEEELIEDALEYDNEIYIISWC